MWSFGVQQLEGVKTEKCASSVPLLGPKESGREASVGGVACWFLCDKPSGGLS